MAEDDAIHGRLRSYTDQICGQRVPKPNREDGIEGAIGLLGGLLRFPITMQ